MQPRFSRTKNSRWKVELRATPEELELLRVAKKFQHKVILHRKWKEREWDDEDERYRDVPKEESVLLNDFAVKGNPLATFWTFPAKNPKDVEDWEDEVTKRVKTLTAELVMYIPATVPVINPESWFSHAVLIAQTGMGKTNVLMCRLRDLIPLIDQGNATVILMEPKGVLIDTLLHLRAVYKLHQKGRVAIIDPETAPVAVNPFDAGDRSSQAINATIDRLNRIFSLLTAGLSSFQTVVMQMAVRAMFESGMTPSMATPYSWCSRSNGSRTSKKPVNG